MALPAPVCVALIDDCDLVLHGLTGILCPFADRVAFTGRFDPDAETHTDVLLYDPDAYPASPGTNIKGIQARTGARILIYTWSLTPEFMSTQMAKGAGGVARKSAPAPELVEAIERVHRHEAPITFASLGGEHGLTGRETQTLVLIANGASNQEIADRLFLSINSIKTYVRVAYRKIGVSRRADAVRWCIEHGLADVAAGPARSGNDSR